MVDELIILEDIFEQLPIVDNGISTPRKPSFFYGTTTDLNAFLSSKKSKKIYPIIYLITPYTLDGNLTSLTFVLAVNNTKINMSNKERLIKVFNKYLFPLRDNIKYALTISKAIKITDIDDIRQTKYFGYHINKENFSGNNAKNDNYELIDIWDALKIQIPISIHDCEVNDNIF